MSGLALVLIAALTACQSTSESDAPLAAPAATVASPTVSPDQALVPSPTATTPPTSSLKLLDGQRVVVLGSNVWPLVGSLLALDVVPAGIVSQSGRDGAPGYFTAAHGDAIDDVPLIETNLFDPDVEALAALQADLFVLPAGFESLLSDQLLTVMGGPETVVFADVFDWRQALTTIIEKADEDPADVLAPLDAIYEQRIVEIRDSLDYDPAEVVFSSFTWQRGQLQLAPITIPLGRVMTDLGFAIHEPAFPDEFTMASTEQILQFDADLVMIQVNSDDGFDFATLQQDPLWSLATSQQAGNTFERFQYGTQGGWLETLQVLEDLAEYLPIYQHAN